jgi:putative flippase GtrA
MQETGRSIEKRLWSLLHRSSVAKFLIVGGLSFAIDLGTLAVLHDLFHVDLWIATPIAFIVSLLFNFGAQRSFTFRSNSRRDLSFLKYIALVAFNTVATDVIVNAIAAVGLSYAIGKVVSTGLTMAWNYFLYRHWIFKRSQSERAFSHATRSGDGATQERDL